MTKTQLLHEMRYNSFAHFGEMAAIKMDEVDDLTSFSVRTSAGDVSITIDNETLDLNEDNLVDKLLNLLKVTRDAENAGGE